MNHRKVFGLFPYPLQFLYFALICIGCLLLSSNIGALFSILIFGMENMWQTPSLLLIQTFSAIGTFLLPALWLKRMKAEQSPDYLKFRKHVGAFPFLFFLLAYIVLIPGISWLEHIGESWHFPEQWESLNRFFENKHIENKNIIEKMFYTDSIGIFLASLFVVSPLTALCEECFFRGGLQNLFYEWSKGKKHLSVWITAVIFSAAHLDLTGFLPRCLLGALLGYSYLLYGSIWLPVFLHAINNGLTAFLLFLQYNGHLSFSVEDYAFPLSINILSIVLSAFLIGIVIRKHT